MAVKQRQGRVAVNAFTDSPAAARKRVLVLDGTFSIEEIEVSASRKKKTGKPRGKKTARKTARKKSAAAGKRVVKKAAAKKTARQKAVAKTRTVKKSAGKKVVAARADGNAAAGASAEMPESKSRSAEPVVLSPQQDIKSICELHGQLGNAFRAESNVVIDASQVAAIDTAALQLLAAFASSVRGQSRAVEWRDPSESFRELADLTDMSSALGLDDGPVDDDDGLLPVF